MANICDFSMRVRGEHEDIEKFYNAMIQNGNVYMGRGADAEIIYDDDDTANISGWCKWSICSAMINNAISMREETDKWYFGENFNVNAIQFVTLIEACEMFNVDMEVFSEEPGCCFQEHYLVVNGDVLIDECTEWNEYCIDDYENKEEAEKELGIVITDAEWESGDSFISRGGFGEWDFEI